MEDLMSREKDVKSKMINVETSSGRLWQCTLCGFSHKKTTNVVDHIESHLEKVSCQYCGKWFTRTSSLKQHFKYCEFKE